MLFQGSLYGPSLYMGLPVAASSFSKIAINGEAKFKDLKISNITKTITELDAVDTSLQPEWDGYTIFLALFDNTTDAGNIKGISSIDLYHIYRRAIDENSFTFLEDVDGVASTISDFIVQNGKSYKYQIFPASESKLAAPIETGFIKLSFETYYLSSKTLDKTYKLTLEHDLGNISHNKAETVIETQSKYPSTLPFGEMDYRSGSFEVIPGEFSDEITLDQSIAFLEEFEEFLKDSEEKIFKTPKGHVMRIKTSNVQTSFYSRNEMEDGPMVYTWDWIETAEL